MVFSPAATCYVHVNVFYEPSVFVSVGSNIMFIIASSLLTYVFHIEYPSLSK